MELTAFLEEINVKYSYDFRHYSRSSMKRRIAHAMNLMECSTMAELQEKVLSTPKIFEELMQYITVPVSSMFRDPSYFLSLREKVFPYLKTYPSLKIWVAGCSTGEEVFSLAILLSEENLLDRTILYATDINETVLAKAKKGIFKTEELEKSEPLYQQAGGKRALSDYYTLSEDTAEFDHNLIKRISFVGHSLATDAVFSETHFISCRNVLIYFDSELQNKALDLFHESLLRKGFLGLGSKEDLLFSNHEDTFSRFVKKDRIFQKN